MSTVVSLLTDAAVQDTPASFITWIKRDDTPDPQYDWPNATAGIYDLEQLLGELHQNPDLPPLPDDASAWLDAKVRRGTDIFLYVSW